MTLLKNVLRISLSFADNPLNSFLSVWFFQLFLQVTGNFSWSTRSYIWTLERTAVRCLKWKASFIAIQGAIKLRKKDKGNAGYRFIGLIAKKVIYQYVAFASRKFEVKFVVRCAALVICTCIPRRRQIIN